MAGGGGGGGRGGGGRGGGGRGGGGRGGRSYSTQRGDVDVNGPSTKTRFPASGYEAA